MTGSSTLHKVLAAGLALCLGLVVNAGPATGAPGGRFDYAPDSGPPGTVVNASSGADPCPPPGGANNAFGQLALADPGGQIVGQSQPFQVSPAGAWSARLTVPNVGAGSYQLLAACGTSNSGSPYFSYGPQPFGVTSAQASTTTASSQGAPVPSTAVGVPANPPGSATDTSFAPAQPSTGTTSGTSAPGSRPQQSSWSGWLVVAVIGALLAIIVAGVVGAFSLVWRPGFAALPAWLIAVVVAIQLAGVAALVWVVSQLLFGGWPIWLVGPAVGVLVAVALGLSWLPWWLGVGETHRCPLWWIAFEQLMCKWLRALYHRHFAKLDRLFFTAQAASNAYNSAVSAFNASASSLQGEVDAFNAAVNAWDASSRASTSQFNALTSDAIDLQIAVNESNAAAAKLNNQKNKPNKLRLKYFAALKKKLPWFGFVCITCLKPIYHPRTFGPLATPNTVTGPNAPKPVNPAVPAAAPAVTHERCQCHFEVVATETERMEVRLQSHADASGAVAWLDAAERRLALTAEADVLRSLNVTGSDDRGAAPIVVTLVVPIDRFEFTWRVDDVRVEELDRAHLRVVPGGPHLKPTMRIRGSLDAKDEICALGTLANGCGVILAVAVDEFYVDWIEGSGNNHVLKGKLADFEVDLTCIATAAGQKRTLSRKVTVRAEGQKREVRPIEFFHVAVTVDPPNPQRAAHPRTTMELIDPEDRDETCEPDAGWRVVDLTCKERLRARTVTAGDLVILEADSLVNTDWRVYPEDPGCGNKVVTEVHQRARAAMTWDIGAPTPASDRGSPLEFIGPAGPDAAVFYARRVDELTECRVTATSVPLEEYVDPSGHGPLLTPKTAAFRVTIKPRRLRMVLLDATGQPLAKRHCRLTVEGGDAVTRVLGDNGVLDEPIDPTCVTATLELLTEDDAVTVCAFDLTIGDLYSIYTQTGITGRFNNLGLAAGPETDAPNGRPFAPEVAARALQRFQALNGVTTGAVVNQPNVTGKVDLETVNKLKEVYDDRYPN